MNTTELMYIFKNKHFVVQGEECMSYVYVIRNYYAVNQRVEFLV